MRCKFRLLMLFVSGITWSIDSAGQPRDLNNQIDSLTALAHRITDNSAKLSMYESLVSILLGADKADSACVVAQQAVRLIPADGDPRLRIRALFLVAASMGNYGSREYGKSLQHAYEAAEIAAEHNLSVLQHDAYSVILNLYFYAGDFARAMEVSKKGLMLAERTQEWERISHYYSLFGFIYLRQGNHAEAFRYYTIYAQLCRQHGDSLRVADSYNCLGELMLARKQFDRALDLHLRAWHIYREAHADKVAFKVDQLAYTAFMIASAHRMLGNLPQALEYTMTGFEYNEKIPPNEYDVVNYLLQTGQLYTDLRRYPEALLLFHRAAKLSKKIKHLENIRDSYSRLAETHRILRAFDSAYHYQSLAGILKDSIVNERSKREIDRINAEYNVARKDREIAMQQAELDRQNFQRNAIIAVFVFAITILILLYGRHRLKLKNKFQEELSAQQTELFTTIVTFQDSERKRIAQDIHDSVGSILSAAKLQLSAIEDGKDNLTEEQVERYRTAMLLMDEATTEVRNIAHHIMPPALSKLGLVAALESQIEKIRTLSGLQVNFNVFGFQDRLGERTEIGIYPVVLELLNNVLKHARASQAIIQLVRHPTYINITVEDNGKGFDPTNAQGKGMGLQNVRSRIQYLKGSVNIDSSVGRGTLIMIDIPY